MKYWRMQLHPCDGARSAEYAARSLSAGFIGLDFHGDTGDLTIETPDSVIPGQRDYFGFSNSMSVGDKVLIMVHHFPFALCTVDGEYNYIKHTAGELGIWFRHFRRVKDVKLFADRVTNAKAWPNIVMTDTISPLHDPGSKSYRLIEEWV